MTEAVTDQTNESQEPFDPWKVLENHPAFAKEIDPANMDPAMEALQALKYESDNPDANAESYKDEGNYHYKRKEFRKAIDSYTVGLRIKPPDMKLVAMLLTNRAICHWYLKNHGSCIRDCKSAIVADSKHEKAYVKAVEACLELKKGDECLEFCSKGLAIFPNCEKLVKAQLEALRLLGDAEVKAEKESKLHQKVQDKRDMTFKMIQERGIKVNPKLPPISVPEAAGARFFVDPSNRIHWSVMFMYAEFGQTDFLQDVVETSKVIDCLRIVFDPEQPAPSWDVNRHYTCDDDSIEVYFEDSVKSQQLVSFPTNLSIKRLTRRPEIHYKLIKNRYQRIRQRGCDKTLPTQGYVV